MNFVQLSENEFTSFANTHPLRNLWQTKEMANIRKQRGFEIYYVGVKEKDTVLAATMLTSITVFMGHSLVQALRGYLIDFENKELLSFFHQEIKSFLKEKKCLLLRIDPYYQYLERDLDGNVVNDGFNHQDVVDHLKLLGYKHGGFSRGIDSNVEPRWIYTIPYKNLSAEELFKTFERKTQRSIRKAEKFNVRVRELSLEQIPLFMEVMEHTEERRGFEGRSKEYYETLYREYAPNDNIKFLYCELYVDDYIQDLMKDLNAEKAIESDCIKHMETQSSTKYQKKLNLAKEQISQLEKKLEEANELKQEEGDVIVLSSGVFFTYGKETLCLLSGVYDKYMRFASPYAMHFKMMKESIDKGQERYNLYGISGVFDPDAQDYGVYLFKKGFNGEVEELIGEFTYIFHPVIHTLYNTLRKLKHLIKK